MRNSRICPENNARFSNLMCENAHRAALTLSLEHRRVLRTPKAMTHQPTQLKC